jgi:hypothetical protein
MDIFMKTARIDGAMHMMGVADRRTNMHLIEDDSGGSSSAAARTPASNYRQLQYDMYNPPPAAYYGRHIAPARGPATTPRPAGSVFSPPAGSAISPTATPQFVGIMTPEIATFLQQNRIILPQYPPFTPQDKGHSPPSQ